VLSGGGSVKVVFAGGGVEIVFVGSMSVLVLVKGADVLESVGTIVLLFVKGRVFVGMVGKIEVDKKDSE
jgi:hypothetical protein